MLEANFDPKSNPEAITTPVEPTYDSETKFICLCKHGRSRSKYTARALSKLGFDNARAFSTATDATEIDDVLREFPDTILVFTAPDVRAHFEHANKIKAQTIDFYIPQNEHVILNVSKDQEQLQSLVNKYADRFRDMGIVPSTAEKNN